MTVTNQNHLYDTVSSDMKLAPNVGSDRSWVWSVAADVSEGEPAAETLAIRFGNSESGCWAFVSHLPLNPCPIQQYLFLQRKETRSFAPVDIAPSISIGTAENRSETYQMDGGQ